MFCAANFGLDKVHEGMPVSKFSEELDLQNAGSGDRVVINGGEPTIHPEFFEFIREANKRGSFIDLYTNGIRLGEHMFTEKLLGFLPMMIRIPVFGSTASTHNKLTGKKGNFENIMQAFTLLQHYDQQLENLYIEVKLLLSKATIEQNLQIIKLFEKQYPDSFYFSLNPLISSEKVVRYGDMFLERLSQLVEKSVPLIDYANQKEIPLDINLIPFCLVPSRLKNMIHLPERPEFDESYNDPFDKKSLNNKFETKKCLSCHYQRGCKGFPPHYFDVFDEKEVVPFT